jgi:hypothetical protein
MRRVSGFFRDHFSASIGGPLRPGSYVAVQVRAFSYKEMPDLANAFHHCVEQARGLGDPQPFFLATMHDAIRSNFARRYDASILRTQSARVAGDQLTRKGAAADVEALTDMILLAIGRPWDGLTRIICQRLAWTRR